MKASMSIQETFALHIFHVQNQLVLLHFYFHISIS